MLYSKEGVIMGLKLYKSTLFVIGLLLLSVSITPMLKASALSDWTFNAATYNSVGIHGKGFYDVAISSDGKYMYSAAHSYGIYISDDYGQTWHKSNGTTTEEYVAITTSADGKYVYIAGNAHEIWKSSDFGETWTISTVAPLNNFGWGTVKTSDDGKDVIAGTEGQPNEGIYVSNDYGSTWNSESPATDGLYYATAVSGNGSYMLAPDSNGDVYISSDHGNTWTTSTAPNGLGYNGSSISTDGKYMVLAAVSNGIYYSSDYGVSWTKSSGTDTQSWYDISISGTGQYGVAVDYGGDIWTSKDYGVTWTDSTIGTDFQNKNFQGVVISQNGKYMMATIQDTDIIVGINSNVVLTPP